MIGTTAAVLGGISAGSSLLGGIFGSSAAKKAAEAQAKAAQAAADQMGVATNEATHGVADATQAGQGMVTNAIGSANDVLGGVYNRQLAMLSPYQAAGADAVQSMRDWISGGNATREFTGADMQAYDPGYQFRLQEAQKALLRSQSASGGMRSGGASKAMASYQQNLASDEFGKAFDRFQQGRAQTFGILSGAAGMGERANSMALSAGNNYGANVSNNIMRGNEFNADLGLRGQSTIGQFGMEGARAKGDFLTQKGNAQASGFVGSANAWNGALKGIGNAAMQTGMLDMYGNGYGQVSGSMPAGYTPPSASDILLGLPPIPQGPVAPPPTVPLRPR